MNKLKLDALFTKKEPAKKVQIIRPPVRITRHALAKAQAYSRITCEISGEGTMECGGFLIAPADSDDGIATDAFLAVDQEVREGLYRLQGEDVIKNGRILEEFGFKALGWWHSHGTMNTFFSDLDNEGQAAMLNEVASINLIAVVREREMSDLVVEMEGTRMIVYDRERPQRRLVFECRDAAAPALVTGTVLEDKRIGYSYGIVVNNRGQESTVYAEVATRELCSWCRADTYKSQITDIEIVDSPVEIDEDQLRHEVRERVSVSKRWTFWGFLKNLPIWELFGRKFLGEPDGNADKLRKCRPGTEVLVKQPISEFGAKKHELLSKPKPHRDEKYLEWRRNLKKKLGVALADEIEEMNQEESDGDDGPVPDGQESAADNAAENGAEGGDPGPLAADAQPSGGSETPAVDGEQPAQIPEQPSDEPIAEQVAVPEAAEPAAQQPDSPAEPQPQPEPEKHDAKKNDQAQPTEPAKPEVKQQPKQLAKPKPGGMDVLEFLKMRNAKKQRDNDPEGGKNDEFVD